MRKLVIVIALALACAGSFGQLWEEEEYEKGIEAGRNRDYSKACPYLFFLRDALYSSNVGMCVLVPFGEDCFMQISKDGSTQVVFNVTQFVAVFVFTLEPLGGLIGEGSAVSPEAVRWYLQSTLWNKVNELRRAIKRTYSPYSWMMEQGATVLANRYYDGSYRWYLCSSMENSNEY